ncbi:hypothetical protein AB3S75_003192 [Citrus x aurantiifolia]
MELQELGVVTMAGGGCDADEDCCRAEADSLTGRWERLPIVLWGLGTPDGLRLIHWQNMWRQLAVERV